MNPGDVVLYRASTNDLVEAVVVYVSGDRLTLDVPLHDEAVMRRANVTKGDDVGQWRNG